MSDDRGTHSFSADESLPLSRSLLSADKSGRFAERRHIVTANVVLMDKTFH